MSASTETRTRDTADQAPAADLAPRVLSRDPDDFALPTGREEAWRFTPLRRFASLLAGERSSAHLHWETVLPEGVVVDELPADDPFLATLPLPVDRLSAVAVGRAGGAVRVTVPESAPHEAVVLRLRGDDATAVVQGHVVLDVRPFAQATVVLEHSGGAQYVEHLSVVVGDGAALRLLHVQAWDDDSVHAAHVAVRVGRDATFRSFRASLGGGAVRILETVEYAGPGGDVELLGLFFADAGQHLEHRILVDHAVPHCRSNVLYKGALAGDVDAGEDGIARSVWVGDVLIRAAAVGTETYELNRNLLLTEATRADSVPNLEIETGEIVGAGHASATGRFDDEQLFYLQSRGIPADVATRLVVRGFFADVIGRLDLPEWESVLQDRIDSELGFDAYDDPGAQVEEDEA